MQAETQNAMQKRKRRTNAAKKKNDDLASSNANVQCGCDAWAAKTIAKLFCLDVAASAQRCVFRSWPGERSRRSRAFTHNRDGFGRAAEKKKAATRAGRVAQGLTLRPRRSMDGRCARLASGSERDSRDAVNGHGWLFRCSLDGRI